MIILGIHFYESSDDWTVAVTDIDFEVESGLYCQ